MEQILRFLPSTAAVAAIVIGLVILHRVLERRSADARHHFRDQWIMLGATAAGLFLVVLTLPLTDAMRGQILSLIGIVLSAGIALSSTTFLGNAMAGVMLRSVRNFRMGDFIRCGEHFGRVSERGLFHTEIQTQERELTTLPNLYLVTNAVTTVRSSGTIVSAVVSLGYDVPRRRIEKLLIEAAERMRLGDPFVQILELGDFSVSYRVAGLLTDTKTLVSTQSLLRGAVLDALHEDGVEIVSPNFMNQRVLATDQVFIPTQSDEQGPAGSQRLPEQVVFDKAEHAESLQSLRTMHEELVADCETLEAEAKKLPEGPEREQLEADLERRRKRAASLQARIEARSEDHHD